MENNMNIALIGYGKMGKKIEEIAVSHNLTVTSVIDPHEKGAGFKTLTSESVEEADVCIDFSLPGEVVNNVTTLSRLNKNIVIGTTGWYQNIDVVKKLVEENNNGLIYAGNFSLGMNLFYKIVEFSSKLFNEFSEYDVAGLEMHHNKKADSPSGTAKELSNILINNITRKERSIFDRPTEKIDPAELQFSSVRCGQLPGTHKIIFDSMPDTIELTHTARSRDGFAHGALLAAEWIFGKKGFFTFDDLITNKIKIRN
jgi:4-hydroxy-tetrahydrodipicolinate reductase